MAMMHCMDEVIPKLYNAVPTSELLWYNRHQSRPAVSNPIVERDSRSSRRRTGL